MQETCKALFTIYSANYTGNPSNCLYPKRIEVVDEDTLKEAVMHDYVCAEYKENYRNNSNFLGANCLPVDVDNDHSDDPRDWVRVDDVKDAFPNVTFAVHYSRNHLKEKNGKAARPKFHILFPIDSVINSNIYSGLKKRLNTIFPYFDKQALDAARFFFGTSSPKVMIIHGTTNLTEFLEQEEFDAHFDEVIKDGTRNSTLSKFAGRILIKLGDTEEAYNQFLLKAEKCETPMEEDELNTIWNSAKRFYKKVSQESSYIPPEVYNDDTSYKPEDYSDVGQAEVMAKHFQNELRYSPATHFIRYRGHYWQESEPGAQAVAHELTRRQLNEAEKQLINAHMKLKQKGIMDVIAGLSSKKIEATLDEDQMDLFKEYREAITYKDYAIHRRESKCITATLKEIRPMIEIDTKALNSDAFLLNTPLATYDLRKGIHGARAHDPEDFITKITAVSPSDKGKDVWLDCLNTIFNCDHELIEYVQMICGLAAIGKVFVEAMIIAYGEGGNGKSTFWNSIFRVLGLYSGKISADTLTVGCRRNIKPEMAEMNGRRLLIASESQEGARLNDSIVKQLCSTDEVFAEKKYKDPFYFTPCHTLVLYTNHLPRVSGNDEGIWRRLIVIPFTNKLTGSGDIKNYADYLFENAGEYILTWIIEGAKKVIDKGYNIPVPKVVKDAIDEYREQNDWFHHFLEDCCDVDSSYMESSNDLYKAYCKYCDDTNEFKRNALDFYNTLETKGFTKFSKKRKRFIKGLKLKVDDEFYDFLT